MIGLIVFFLNGIARDGERWHRMARWNLMEMLLSMEYVLLGSTYEKVDIGMIRS